MAGELVIRPPIWSDKYCTVSITSPCFRPASAILLMVLVSTACALAPSASENKTEALMALKANRIGKLRVGVDEKAEIAGDTSMQPCYGPMRKAEYQACFSSSGWRL